LPRFRARLLAVLLEQGVTTQELIDVLLIWNHNSGFNIHAKGRISGFGGDAIENVDSYMSGADISVERVKFNLSGNTVTVYENLSACIAQAGKTGLLPAFPQPNTIMEFMALLAGHIPSPYESLVYYYGVYSSSYRWKERIQTDKTGSKY
jgi:hypothetical protein